MEYSIAKLQEIVRKVQYYSKLNFRNAIDIDLVLETEGVEVMDVNKLISAGVRIVAYSSMDCFVEAEPLLLPCRKFYTGNIAGENLAPILANFERIETISEIADVGKISTENIRSGRITDLMVRLNVLSTIKAYGFMPSEIQDVSLEIAKHSGVRLIGMHTYVPPVDNEKLRCTALRKAGTVFKMLNNRFRGVERFSINYICHFEDMIAEGVNELRIGVKNLA